jgi:hypothetical protein
MVGGHPTFFSAHFILGALTVRSYLAFILTGIEW